MQESLAETRLLFVDLLQRLGGTGPDGKVRGFSPFKDERRLQQVNSSLRNAAVVLGMFGCITLIGFIVSYTVRVNVFLMWDAIAYRYIVINILLLTTAIGCSVLLNHRKHDYSLGAAVVLCLLGLVVQMLFGFELKVFLGVASLYLAGVLGMVAALGNTPADAPVADTTEASDK